MKRRLVAIIIWICSIVPLTAKAQYYFYNENYYYNPVVFELGGSIGLMNCLTDLGGKKGIGKNFIKDLNLKNSRPSFSLYGLLMYKDVVGFRLEGTFGSIQAFDSILKSVAPTTFGRYERNLSFKSSISDLQMVFEIHPLFFKSYDNNPPQFSPFLLGGIGFFSFNPQAKLNGRWYDLQPLHTEGEGFEEYPERKNYSLHQISFPVGIGLKYEVNSFLNARFELVHRILRTDYLDDVSTTYIDPGLFSNYLPPGLAAIAQQLYDRQGELDPNHIPTIGGQRGDPKHNDAFFSFQLKLGITIGRERRPGR